MRHRLVLTLLALLMIAAFAGLPAAAQATLPGDPARVTLNGIFNSPEFVAQRLGDARWLPGGDAYTTIEPSAVSPPGKDLVRYDAATGRRDVLVSASRLVPPNAATPLDVESYEWSPDGRQLLVYTNSQRVWRENTRGDYWIVNVANGRPRKLGGNAAPSTLMFATFSPDGDRVAYVRENNLYVEGVASGRITALTRDGSRTTINGTFDWVNEEEFGLHRGFRWSPDGTRIAYWQVDDSGVRDFLLLNNTDSLYSHIVPVQYPKAGTTNAAIRVGVVSAAGGPTRWLRVPGDARNNYIARMDWAGGSNDVTLQQLNRTQNTLTLLLGDVRTGAVRPILTDRDSAWVDVVNDVAWFDSGRSFTWVSERDGWRHLYVVSRDGKATRLITPGQFDVHNPGSLAGTTPQIRARDDANGWVYFTASPENPTQLYLFRARLDGQGKPERVTPPNATGMHFYNVAPNARWAFHTFSSFDTPPVTELVRLPAHEIVRTLVDNAPLRARVAALSRGPAEFFRVDGGNGVQLDGWMMKPPAFDSTKRYPVLFYVYGEPAGQTVQDAWGGGTYFWHLMLTQQGYIVASIDNSGTASPRGRAWRKSIYGAVGVLASREQAAAARAIARRPYVDSTRLGVWGWSGGGSMTLNLLFRSPELYHMGMAVAPVPDQRYYDTIYQERYSGLPQQNAEGYRQGSPITFASRLRGDLLLVHGSGDDNVHFQGTEALINALVAAGKPFSMMEYPNRTHCICEGDGTSRHLFELLTRYLNEHLPRGDASTQ